MKKNIALFTITFVFALFNLAAAQTATPKVAKRQITQKVRIAEGIASGALTKRESRQLVRQQRTIKRAKQAAKADGILTRQEQKTINRLQNRANRTIRRKKHNQAKQD